MRTADCDLFAVRSGLSPNPQLVPQFVVSQQPAGHLVRSPQSTKGAVSNERRPLFSGGLFSCCSSALRPPRRRRLLPTDRNDSDFSRRLQFGRRRWHSARLLVAEAFSFVIPEDHFIIGDRFGGVGQQWNLAS